MKNFVTLFDFFVWTLHIVASQQTFNQKIPAIAFKRQNTMYTWIYDDSGTKGDHDLAIYESGNYQYGFFRLGDVAVGSHSRPTSSSVLVMDLAGDALAPPKDFVWVYDDAGTKGDHDGVIYRMEPPAGYVCLGHVAMGKYDVNPDKNKYRCVKMEFVTKGSYEWIWSDSGSRGDHDCVIRSNRVSDADTYGIDAGTFTAFGTYQDQSDTPYVLDGRDAKNILDLNLGKYDAPLTLYEMTDVEQIWNDAGSQAHQDISVWRVKGPGDAFSLGDHAKGSHGTPGSLVAAKARWEYVLSTPVDFTKVWDDAGSKGDHDGAFYKPRCKPGHRPIGHVAVTSHTTLPDSSSIRCVNETYTMPGEWEYVWDDSNSGGDQDGSVYESVATLDGQGVGAMSTIRGHTTMDVPAYVLNPVNVNYVTGPPAKAYLLTNVVYNFDDSDVYNQQPESIERGIVDNHGDTSQMTTFEIDYAYSEEYTWNNHIGGEYGVETTITAGVPFIVKEEITMSATATYEHEWGGSTTKEITNTVKADVVVAPCSTKEADITGRRYTMDVPYTATLTTIYEDDSTGIRENIEGVFKGIEVNEIRVVYGPDIPMEGGCGSLSRLRSHTLKTPRLQYTRMESKFHQLPGHYATETFLVKLTRISR